MAPLGPPRPKRWPHEAPSGEGVSNPRARVLPGVSSRQKSLTFPTRPSSTAWPKVATSAAVAKRPACPATPSRHQALSSSTSPFLPGRVGTCHSPSWPGAGSRGRVAPVSASTGGGGPG